MRCLRLSLKRVWFDMVSRGIKRDEYRDIIPYYQSRLCAEYDKHSSNCANCKNNFCNVTPKVDAIHFTLGYPTDDDVEKHLILKIGRIRKGRGKYLWGGNPSVRTFIIELETKGGENGRRRQ